MTPITTVVRGGVPSPHRRPFVTMRTMGTAPTGKPQDTEVLLERGVGLQALAIEHHVVRNITRIRISGAQGGVVVVAQPVPPRTGSPDCVGPARSELVQQ